jgi:hypothetical protein
VTQDNTKGRTSLLRSLAYVFTILFLVTATIAIAVGAFTLVTAVAGARAVTQPVGSLFRNLIVEATPVIIPSPAIVVREMNSLARLETASYAFQDVIRIERNRERLWGLLGEELLFVAYGEVIAGVDLAQLSPGDVQVVSPDEVIVHLPKPEIFLSRLDNDRSYVANREVGWLTGADPGLETLVRQESEARMREAALANGILVRAGSQAESFVSGFLNELGFGTVTFVDRRPPPVTPAIPELPKGFVVTPPAPALATPVP